MFLFITLRTLFDRLAGNSGILLLDKVGLCLSEIFRLSHIQFKAEHNPSLTQEDLMNTLISYITQSEAIHLEASYTQTEIKKGIDFNTLKIYTQNYFIENSSINLYTNKHCTLVERMQKTINEYTDLIKQLKDEDITNAIKLKKLLVGQLNVIQENRRVKCQKVVENEKGLKEIFEFYCKQQLLIGKKATFEQLNTVLSNMNLGEFMKFCKDFNINLPSTKIKEVFKKTARMARELDFDLFKQVVQRISNEVINFKLQQLNNQITKENKEKLLEEIQKLEKLTEEDRKKLLYEYMEINNPAKYKKKMVGMVLPFNTHDKESRIPQESLNHRIKPRPTRNLALNSRGHVLIKSKRQKLLQASLIEDNKRNSSKQLDEDTRKRYAKGHSIIMQSKRRGSGTGKVTIRNHIQNDPKLHKEEENTKELTSIIEHKLRVKKSVRHKMNVKKPVELTWKLLTRLSYNDLNTEKDNDFLPEKILEEDDNADIEILKKLNDSPIKDKPLRHNRSEKSKVLVPLRGRVVAHSMEKNRSYDLTDVLNEEQIANKIQGMKKANKNFTKEITYRAQQIEQQEKERIQLVPFI